MEEGALLLLVALEEAKGDGTTVLSRLGWEEGQDEEALRDDATAALIVVVDLQRE